MEEVTGVLNDRVEFEIRGGAWEGMHTVIFYAAVALAVLATAGVLRAFFGIAFMALLFYSMFAIFSSPRYIVIEPGGGISLLKYRYFIPIRRDFERGELEGIEVVESPRPPAEEGKGGSRRDISYFVRVYLRLAGGRRLKVFRSGLTGAPADSRRAAFLITQAMAEAAGLPVSYERRGRRAAREARRNSAHPG